MEVKEIVDKVQIKTAIKELELKKALIENKNDNYFQNIKWNRYDALQRGLYKKLMDIEKNLCEDKK